MGRDGGSLGEGHISGHRRKTSGYILVEEMAGLVLYVAYIGGKRNQECPYNIGLASVSTCYKNRKLEKVHFWRKYQEFLFCHNKLIKPCRY